MLIEPLRKVPKVKAIAVLQLICSGGVVPAVTPRLPETKRLSRAHKTTTTGVDYELNMTDLLK